MPVVTVEDLTDPTRMVDLKEFSLDIVNLGKKRFRARRTTVQFAQSVLVYHTANNRLRTVTQLPDNFVAFHTVGAYSQARYAGLAIRPGDLVVGEPGTEFEAVIEPNYECLVWLVPPESLRSHLAARQRVDEFHPPLGVNMVASDPSVVRGFFETGKSICSLAERNRDFFENESVLSSAELSISEALLTCIGSTTRREMSLPERTSNYYSEVIRKAEKFTLGHTSHRPSISELCKAVNVGERTLQNAFTAIIGMPPAAFLTRLRLHRVRGSLQAASYRSTTVSAAAQEWGFWHFGDFSRAYKKCFNELPSATLRRHQRSYAEPETTINSFAEIR